MRRSVIILALVVAGCSPRQSGRGNIAPAAVVSRTISVPRGGQLYVEWKGQGRPVVFIHGGQLDRRMWDRESDALADQYRVIRYDVRGFGRSPAGSDTTFRSSDDLAALLDSLGIDRTSIVGLSLGGRIAIDFAIAHPERVDRLVLLAPGVSGFPWSTGDTAARAMDKAIEAGDTAEVADLWLRTTFMRPAMANPAIAPRVRELSLANSGARHLARGA